MILYLKQRTFSAHELSSCLLHHAHHPFRHHMVAKLSESDDQSGWLFKFASANNHSTMCAGNKIEPTPIN